MNALSKRLGISGIIGAGLLIFSLSYYFNAVLPDQASLVELQREVSKLESSIPIRPIPSSPTPPSLRTLPPFDSSQDLMAHLATLAEQSSAAISRATFRITKDAGSQRYEVYLPLKTSYPNLRAFLKEALALSPASTIAEIDLHRSLATDAEIEATVHLIYYFSGS